MMVPCKLVILRSLLLHKRMGFAGCNFSDVILLVFFCGVCLSGADLLVMSVCDLLWAIFRF